MSTQKSAFLESGLFLQLNNITAGTASRWGKMNAQQMVEHLSAFFYISVEKITFSLVTPEEHLPKFKEFLLSDKPFRENTKAPGNIIGEEPMPLRHDSYEAAVQELREAVDGFFLYFKNNPGKKTMHPVFGWLNVEEWILLHYKHVTHHLRQFGCE